MLQPERVADLVEERREVVDARIERVVGIVVPGILDQPDIAAGGIGRGIVGMAKLAGAFFGEGEAEIADDRVVVGRPR